MIKKGSLFFLIKSLTKSEKRYFKLFAASDRDSNYLQLFDYIDRQSDYDEAAVKRRFRGQAFAKQLHVTKIYLSKLILRSLRNYHANTSKYAELKDLLRDIEILHRKELLDQCTVAIEKGIRIARKYERQYDLLELLAWKRRVLLQRHGPAQAQEVVNAVLEQEKDALAKTQILHEYWRLTINMFDVLRPAMEGERGGDPIKNNVLLNDPSRADTLQARILYHHIRYAYHTVTGAADAAEQNITELISTIESYPEMIKEDPTSYITAINNKIGLCLQYQRYSEIPPLLAKIKAIPETYNIKKQSPGAVRLLLRTFNLELEWYRDTGQVERGIALSGEVKQFIERHARTVTDDYKLLFLYQFAYMHFMQREYQQSLVWLNEILRTNFGTVRDDIQSFAQLLNLIIHYKLGNTFVLKYAVDSCRRFLKKKRDLYQFEKALLRFFSSVSMAAPDKHRLLLQKLKQELFAGASEGEVRSALDYLDFETWLEEELGAE